MTLVSFRSGCGLDQLGGQPVGLPGGGAVADRDQVDAVGGGEPGEGGERLVPAVARHVRVDRVGGDAPCRCASTTATFTPVRRPGSRPIVARVPAGRGEQQVAQVGGEDPYRLVLGRLAQPDPQVDAEVDQDPGAPGPAHGVDQPAVARAAAVGDAEPLGDAALEAGRALGGLLGLHGEVEHLLLLAAEHGQDAVRGQLGERLGEVEVVGELRALLLLALAHLGDQPARGPHPLAQLADQVGVLGEALDQDRPGAVQRRRRVRARPCRRPRTPRPRACGSRPGRRAARRPAARGRPRGRSAPWSAAWACTAGRCPPAGPWSRRPGSAPRARRRACPARGSTPARPPAAPPAPAGSAAAPPGCAAAASSRVPVTSLR